jgi:diamine N-acetyltransferase
MATQRLIIRKARTADAADLADLARSHAIEAFAAWFHDASERHEFLAELDDTLTEAQFSTAISSSEHEISILVAELDGRLIGFTELRSTGKPPAPREVEIVTVYVTAMWRGRDVASTLMRAAEAEAGIGTVWLAVWDQNARAIAFFTKRGFRASGKRPSPSGRGRKEDVVMVQDVAVRLAGPAPTIRPLIFVSHSAKGNIARRTLEDIVDRLTAANFDVWYDRERLEAGAEWRREIMTNIDRCHGAVILFSEGADESAWVQAEVTMLAQRKWRRPDQFRLLPVFLPPALHEKTFNKPSFEPFELRRLQIIADVGSGGGVDQIVRVLQPLKHGSGTTPLDELIEVVARELPQEQMLLERVAAELGLNVVVGSAEETATLVARTLFDVGLVAFHGVLEKLAAGMTKSGVERVVEVVVPFWVDPKTVAPLARAALSSHTIIPMLNARKDLTARLYIRRAAVQFPLRWTIITVTAAGGEKTASAVIAEMRHLFKRTDPELESFDDDEIDERIAGAAKIRPVLIILPPEIRAASIRAIRTKYPGCTLFIRCGETVPPSERFIGLNVVVLTPELQRALENKVHDLYFACREIARNMV